jgi:hypothetical protein
METNVEFQGFPKMARLSRDVVITEKIDGTNAQIFITEDGDLFVGSRNRWITPNNDNYGFARWVEGNRDDILKLGPGRHFGEWWGSGIQRGYGLTKGDKRLSLFNTSRWALYGTEPQRIPTADSKIEKYQDVLPECVGVVPVIFWGLFSTEVADMMIDFLGDNGSLAAPGFMDPEGIIVFHTAANIGFKKTLKDDGVPKSTLL